MLNFLPLYLAISLIPIVFLACAWWSNRQQASSSTHTPGTSEAAKKNKQWLVTSSRRRDDRNEQPWYRPYRANHDGMPTRGASAAKGTAIIRFVFGGESAYDEPESIEMQSGVSSDTKREDKSHASSSPVISIHHTEFAVIPTTPPPTKTMCARNAHLLAPAAEKGRTSNETSRALTRSPSWEVREERRQPQKQPRIANDGTPGHDGDDYGLTVSTSASPRPPRPWWALPDDEDDDHDRQRPSDPVPLFRFRGATTTANSLGTGGRRP